MRRVVVTGIGLVTPLGSTVTDLFGNLMSGKSGIRRMSSDFSENLSVKIAAEANFDPSMHFSKKQMRSLDRATQIAVAAASRAWEDSGLLLGE